MICFQSRWLPVLLGGTGQGCQSLVLRSAGWALSEPPLFTLLNDSFCLTTGRTTLATWRLPIHLLSLYNSLLNLGTWGWSQGLELGCGCTSGTGHLLSSGEPRLHPQHWGKKKDLEFSTKGISQNKVTSCWNNVLRVENLLKLTGWPPLPLQQWPNTQIKISLAVHTWSYAPRTPVDHMQILSAYSSRCHMDSVSCFNYLSRSYPATSGTHIAGSAGGVLLPGLIWKLVQRKDSKKERNLLYFVLCVAIRSCGADLGFLFLTCTFGLLKTQWHHIF